MSNDVDLDHLLDFDLSISEFDFMCDSPENESYSSSPINNYSSLMGVTTNNTEEPQKRVVSIEMPVTTRSYNTNRSIHEVQCNKKKREASATTYCNKKSKKMYTKRGVSTNYVEHSPSIKVPMPISAFTSTVMSSVIWNAEYTILKACNLKCTCNLKRTSTRKMQCSGHNMKYDKYRILGMFIVGQKPHLLFRSIKAGNSIRFHMPTSWLSFDTKHMGMWIEWFNAGILRMISLDTITDKNVLLSTRVFCLMCEIKCDRDNTDQEGVDVQGVIFTGSMEDKDIGFAFNTNYNGALSITDISHVNMSKFTKQLMTRDHLLK